MKVWLLLLAGCTTVANPNYCDEPSDCNNGRTCDLETHACVLVDASLPDAPIDAFVVRTVQEVRADSTPDGTPVELEDVIVIGVSASGGRLWVQQPGAGPSSGISIFGANTAEIALLNFGDVIDIRGGRKQHFTAPNDFSGRSVIQVSPQGGTISITRKGANVTPIFVDINLFGIGMMTTQEINAEFEKLAGSYVRATQFKVTDTQTIDGFPIGPLLFLRYDLAELPPGVMLDTCFTSVKGVLDYDRQYRLLPQFTADVVIGTGCP